MSVLVITNDYPPRDGGIQRFVRSLIDQLDPDAVTVLASTSPGATEYDAAGDVRVVRMPVSMLLPTPAVTRRAVELLHETGADRVWFGAAAPLGLMATALRAAGARRIIGSTHGHETGWARLPVSRQLLRRIAGALDVTTFITDFTGHQLQRVISDPARLRRLPPGVDVEHFHPDVDGSAIRRRHGIGDEPVVGCISRLVPRKGQDMLIRALPQVLAQVPDARLVIVGGGRDERRLRALSAASGVADRIIITGAVPAHELPAYYAALDLFAMPCRTRRGGLDVEGLGMVYLEAAATAKPVIAGTSGGAPEAVLPGQTGYVVNPHSPAAIARRVIELLTDPAQARRFGQAGRVWVESEWTWQRQGHRLAQLLDLPDVSDPGV